MKIFAFIAALFVLPVAAQTINPATQIQWPRVTGAGVPTASCTSANFGQPYTNTTANTQYVCSTSGWKLIGESASSSWSALTNPTGNLSLVMGSDTTNFTYGATTSTADLMKWTDTASNTGTGALGHFSTASGSAASPLQADANGIGFKVTSAGQLSAFGGTVNAFINMQSLGVLPAAPGSNILQLTVANSITPYQLILPGTQPTSGNTFLSCSAASSSACSWTAASTGTVIASPQFQMPYYSAAGTASTLTGDAGFTHTASGQYLLSTALGIGYTGALPIPWPITVGTTGQFHADASGNVRGLTFNGIALSTAGPPTAYLDQTGNYSTPLLATNNTWTGVNTFSNTVVSNKYIGQFSAVYGTLVLGSGTGATIEKTISDSTPTLVVSENGATTGTGDFIQAKDSGGSSHTILDHSLGLHGSVNGVTLSTGGSPSAFLNGAGNYVAVPFTLGPLSTSTPSNNYGSGCLTFSASFYDLGATPDSWCMQLLIGAGNTPTSTLDISKVAGGTTGATTVRVDKFTAITSVTSPVVNAVQVQVPNVGGTGSVGLVSDNTSSGTVLQTLQLGNGTVPLQTGALTVNNGVCANGNSPAQMDDCGHDEYAGTAPTIAFGTGAGTSPAVGTNLGIRQGGEISILTGSSPAATQPIITVTFSQPYAHYGFCTVSPSTNVTSDPGGPGVSVVSGYADRFVLFSGSTALNALSNHTWFYTCEGY